jgi:hypothetical protein
MEKSASLKAVKILRIVDLNLWRLFPFQMILPDVNSM